MITTRCVLRALETQNAARWKRVNPTKRAGDVMRCSCLPNGRSTAARLSDQADYRCRHHLPPVHAGGLDVAPRELCGTSPIRRTASHGRPLTRCLSTIATHRGCSCTAVDPTFAIAPLPSTATTTSRPLPPKARRCCSGSLAEPMSDPWSCSPRADRAPLPVTPWAALKWPIGISTERTQAALAASRHISTPTAPCVVASQVRRNHAAGCKRSESIPTTRHRLLAATKSTFGRQRDFGTTLE
jgi:hypothetical protein